MEIPAIVGAIKTLSIGGNVRKVRKTEEKNILRDKC